MSTIGRNCGTSGTTLKILVYFKNEVVENWIVKFRMDSKNH